MPLSTDPTDRDDPTTDQDRRLTDFGLYDSGRALWTVTTHTDAQLALTREDEPQAVQVSHQSDGWLVILYREASAPLPIAYRSAVATVDVHGTVCEMIDEAESLRPPAHDD